MGASMDGHGRIAILTDICSEIGIVIASCIFIGTRILIDRGLGIRSFVYVGQHRVGNIATARAGRGRGYGWRHVRRQRR